MEEFSCVLCEKRAMMVCESDQAKLCWDCDEKVHSANFLVAKHSRVLLCRLCHAPTPWQASGTKLTPTVSFCLRCVADRNARWEHLVTGQGRHSGSSIDDDAEHVNGHVYDDNDDDSYDDDEEEEDEDEDDEEGENQVVPMSSASATSPSGIALKRLRNNSFSVDSSNHETACSSSEMISPTLPSGDESTSMSIFKRHRVDKRN